MYVENVEMQLNRLPSHSVSLLDTINIASIGVNNTNSAVYTRDSRPQKIISFGGEDLFWSIFEDTSDLRRQQGLWFEPKKSAGSRLTAKNSLSVFEKIQDLWLSHRTILAKELKHASWIFRHYTPEYFFAVFSHNGNFELFGILFLKQFWTNKWIALNAPE